MPSQLRARAIASGFCRPSPRREGLTATAPLNRSPPVSIATRDAMRSIQARIDHINDAVDSPAPGADIHARIDRMHRELFPSDDDEALPPVSSPSAVLQPTTDAVSRPPAAKRTRLDAEIEGRAPCEPPTSQVDTRDGRTKIYIRGYEFTRASITRIKITYRCSFYRSQDCAAKLTFFASTMDYDFLNMVPHTCVPPSRARAALNEGARVEIVRPTMQRDVDAMAIEGASTPTQIWDAVSDKYYNREDVVVVRGLSKSQVLKRVHRTRSAHFGSDIHGRVELPPLSVVKGTALNFFQFHHVWTNHALKTDNKIDRVIAWAHPALVTLLRYGKISLFVDGTFRCVPRTFKQCVVIMVYDQGTKLYIPVFYVLAASKTYDAYWNILQYVSDACGERIQPQQIVCDFEIALIRAVQDWYPDTDVVGCFFHFKQACQRKMIKLYVPKAEVKIAMEPGVLDMLTVVDQDKIKKQGIAWVESRIEQRCAEDGVDYSTSKWRQFWAYFRKTWLKLLPPSVWNVHGLRRDVVARTNNPLERFNRELNHAFGSPHPPVPRFVQTIEETSRRYARLRDDIIRGVAAPPKRDTTHNLPTPVVLPEVAENTSDSDEGATGEDEDDDSEDDRYLGLSGEEEEQAVL